MWSYMVVWKIFLLGCVWAFPGDSAGKYRRHRFNLDSGRSPGEGNGYPLQYSCLGNSVNEGAWQVIVHGITKSWI